MRVKVRDEAAAAGNVRIQSSSFARTAAVVPEPKADWTGPDRWTGSVKPGHVPIGSRPHCREASQSEKKTKCCGADTKSRHPNERHAIQFEPVLPEWAELAETNPSHSTEPWVGGVTFAGKSAHR